MLSSLKKFTSSTPNCWAPTRLTKLLTTLSPDPWIKINNYSVFADNLHFSSLAPFSSSPNIADSVAKVGNVGINFFLAEVHMLKN